LTTMTLSSLTVAPIDGTGTSIIKFSMSFEK
jgi:hypothetical protein